MPRKPCRLNALRVKKSAQPVDKYDPYEGEQQPHGARDVTHEARVRMNEIIAVDGRNHAQDPDQRDSGRIGHAWHKGRQGLSAKHQVGGEEAHVHHDDDADDEQRTEGAGIDLGFAPFGALRGSVPERHAAP